MSIKLRKNINKFPDETFYDAKIIDFPKDKIPENGNLFETKKNYIWKLYDKNNVNEDDDQLRAVTGICFMFAILIILGLYSNLF